MTKSIQRTLPPNLRFGVKYGNDPVTVVGVDPMDNQSFTPDAWQFQITHDEYTYSDDGLSIMSHERVTKWVDPTELAVSPESGHRRHCLAEAMMSAVQNARDDEAMFEFDFGVWVQDNGVRDWSNLYLEEGMQTCICLTSKGLI